MQTARTSLLVLIVLGILAALILPAQAAPSSAPTNPGTTNLISWWSLNETSGTRADSHGTNSLSDNNTVGYITGGKQGYSAYFTAANSEYLSTSNLSLTSFSIAMWVRLTTKTTFQVLASKWYTTTNNRVWNVAYSNSADAFTATISKDGTNQTSVTASNFGSPSTLTWYFVVVTFSSGNNLSISVNGGTPNTTSTTDTLYSGTANVLLGAINNGAAFPMDGSLDEVALYSRVLTSDEIAWLYNSGTGRTYGEVNPTPTPTNTFTATSTATATATRTNTPTATATGTNTFTPTATVPTNTFTPTATVPTSTFTYTATVPTNTFTATATVPTNTFTPTGTDTLTPTETFTPTVTFTPTITFTPTMTRTPGIGMPDLTWDSTISYGEFSISVAISLLILVVVIGLLVWFVITTLQKRRNK